MKCLASRWAAVAAVAILSTGCQSPYHADRGALFGGLLGAGTGAIIGDAAGNAGAGAALGAGLGAITGAAVGGEMDEIEARNRALIEAQMGRQVRAGAVTMDDVIAMTQAGVDEELIVNHIRANGVSRPPGTQELIYLNEQGVGKRVIMAMQEPPPQPRQAAGPVVIQRPPPVIVEEYPYGPPVWGPPVWGPPVHYHYMGRRPRPGVSWGLSFGN